jgi:CubicO group peptidase (beta-lactamase class C family)
MRVRLTVLSAIALAGTAGVAAPQNPSAIEHHLRYGVRIADQPDVALDLIDRMKSYHVPGLSIAVIDNYKVVFAKGYGVTEFGGSRRVDSTTLFLAGSISKPVFTSGFLRLVEDRKISLDSNVNTLLKSWHLPDSRFTEHEKVTLRRLLTHSAGLTVWGFPGYSLTAAIPTVPQLLEGTPPANTPAVRNDTTPGARWLYSGGGITIAQLVSTDVSGEAFPSLLHRLMLQPAGMSRSTYENPLPLNRRREAASGHEQLDTPVPGGFHVYPEMAAAGLWTTPSDLARWAIALSRSYRGERGGVLSTTMAKQMVSKQMHQQPPYGDGYWGLGVAVAGDGDSLSFSHGGRDEGFVADMFMRPNTGRGLVIMMNGVDGGLMTEIERAYAEEYGFGAPTRVTRTVATVPAAQLGQYTGSYVRVAGKDTTRLDVSVALGSSMLAVYNQTAKRSIPLAPLGEDKFVGLEGGSEWTFERGGQAAGSVKSLALGAGPNRRVFVRQ